MKTISAMDMRKHMGEYLDEVRLKSETLILERAGKAVAMLIPITNTRSSEKDKIRTKINALKQLSGISAQDPRNKNIDKWLQKERDDWGSRS